MSLAQQLSMEDALERDGAWSHRAAQFISQLPVGATFTSDTLRASCGDPMGPGNAVGAVIHQAAQNRHEIRFTGESVMSVRPEARGRWVRCWERI